MFSYSGASQETLSQSVGSSRANSLPRPLSPSPSVASDKNNGGDFHVSYTVSLISSFFFITILSFMNK